MNAGTHVERENRLVLAHIYTATGALVIGALRRRGVLARAGSHRTPVMGAEAGVGADLSMVFRHGGHVRVDALGRIVLFATVALGTRFVDRKQTTEVTFATVEGGALPAPRRSIASGRGV